MMTLIRPFFASCLLLCSEMAFSQQSLFNVPSVETTEKSKWFFQEQVDLFSNGVANTTLDYGLGDGWETGLTVPGVNFYGNHVTPVVLVNVQKGFHLSQDWKVGIGTQSGYTVASGSSGDFASFNYVNNAIEIEDLGKYYLGVYSANRVLAGGDATVNVLAGAEIPVTENLHVMSDYIGGKNSLSAATLGVVWYASKSWQFSIGGQFSPLPQSKGHFQGGILEFTFIQL